jgi:DHA2 family multidrug resistance protein
MTIGLMISLTHLNPDTGADQLFWPLIWRGFSSVLMFFPLSLAALGPIPKKDVASASGFFSLTRQLGGSIGIAGITTLVAKQQFVHRSQLVYDISNSNPNFQPRLDANTSYLQTLTGDPARLHSQALTLLDNAVNVQSALLSYRDVFYFVAFIFAVSLPLVLLLGKRPAPAPAIS